MKELILPTKQKGQIKERLTIRVDPTLTEAMRMVARQQTALQGVKISIATIVVSGVLASNKEVKRIYKQLNKEQTNVKRKTAYKAPRLINDVTPSDFR